MEMITTLGGSGVGVKLGVAEGMRVGLGVSVGARVGDGSGVETRPGASVRRGAMVAAGAERRVGASWRVGAHEKRNRERKRKKGRRTGLCLCGQELAEGAGGGAEVMAFAPHEAERAVERLVGDAEGVDVFPVFERKLGHEGHA